MYTYNEQRVATKNGTGRWNVGLGYVILIMSHLGGQYKTRTADYGLGIKHGLRHKTQTKHYGLGIKYGLRIKHGLRYEKAHTGWKLHPLSVL